jgi:hypothetical protein
MQAMKSARQYRRRVRGRAQRLRLKSVSISRIRPGGRHRPENIPHVLGISLQVFPLPHRMLPFRDNSPAILCRQNRHSPHARQSLQHAHIFPIACSKVLAATKLNQLG